MKHKGKKTKRKRKTKLQDRNNFKKGSSKSFPLGNYFKCK